MVCFLPISKKSMVIANDPNGEKRKYARNFRVKFSYPLEKQTLDLAAKREQR